MELFIILAHWYDTTGLSEEKHFVNENKPWSRDKTLFSSYLPLLTGCFAGKRVRHSVNTPSVALDGMRATHCGCVGFPPLERERNLF